MYTNIPHEHHKNRTGFALIAVLFSLIILVLLFGTAQKNFLSHSTFLGSQYHKDNADIIQDNIIALGHLYAANPEKNMTVEIDGETYTIEFQDVGGLVDLNTASPELLTLLLEKLGADSPSQRVSQFRKWRRLGYRLQRPSDFARVSGISETIASRLVEVTTIMSGRRGIDPVTAPLELLEILTGDTGSSEYLATKLPPALHSPASGVNFRVEVYDESNTKISGTTVHLSIDNQVLILGVEL